MDRPPTARNGILLWRGVTRACPACGGRGLTRRGVSLREDCPTCRFHFERKAGHFVGAVGMSTIATFGLLLITMLIGIAVMWPDLETLPLLLPMLPVAVFFPILIHPTAKTLWVAIDLMMNPLEPGEADVGTQEGASQQG
jgi:uncharacterized protein (DUF983 family)